MTSLPRTAREDGVLQEPSPTWSDATAASGRIEIIVENSGHGLTNLGDIAMLQVATERLRTVWPRSSIRVLTSAPERLARFCPSTSPLDVGGLHAIADLGYFPGRYRLPGTVALWLDGIGAWLRRATPRLVDRLVAHRARPDPAKRASIEELCAAVSRADLLVVSGGGFLTDDFRAHAMRTVDLLRRFQGRGKPTVLFGQGIGPVDDPGLREGLRSVLPEARVVGLREGRIGPALLESLGVPADRISVTGDDAVEIGFQARAAQIGRGIGINLRRARYAGVGQDDVEAVRQVVRKFARDRGAPLVPVPIALSEGVSDVATLRDLMGDAEDPRPNEPAAETPRGVASRIGTCRLVVAGSYHAGVFAMAQGIPVVGLSKSRYYDAKFAGLAGQFEGGCRVVRLDDPDLSESLAGACRDLWEAGPDLRAGLLAAAGRQIEASHALYLRIGALVTDRSQAGH